jgi:hypothetical protein
LDPIPAIGAAMAIFAGDILGALLRIPGTPAPPNGCAPVE